MLLLHSSIMDNSIGSTLEKIKLQEQDNEARLREKRTIEATLASLTRNVRGATSRAAKLQEDRAATTARADGLDAELFTEQTRRSAWEAQLEASKTDLQRLKEESEQGVSNVWLLRNLLCNEVQKVSDQCDVWALFTKPTHHYIVSGITVKKCRNEDSIQECAHGGILESALQKRQNLLTERDRLLNEPEFGDEFIRIKNALRYSVEMAGIAANKD